MQTVPKDPQKNRKSPQKDYAVRPDLDEGSLETNTSLYFMLQRVGRRKDVLDVGCATGYFAKLMSSHDCNVAGLDSNAEAAEAAKSYCSRVFVADLDFTDLAEAVGGSTFDVIVFGDVLEHLRDPVRILNEARPLLRAGGYVVASIPNIAHGAIRLALLSGDFNYQDLGILDESHLRFFTLRTVDELFLKAGYEIANMDRTKLPLFQNSELVPNISRDDFTEEMIAQVAHDPESDTLQFVMQALPLTDDAKLRNITKRFISANTLLSDAQSRLNRQDILLGKVSAELEEARRILGLETGQALGAATPFNVEAAEASSREQAALRAEIARLTNEESQLQQRVLELQTAHEEILAERTGQIDDLQKGIAALTEDRDMWRDKVASELPLVRAESEEAQRQLEAAQAEIARLTNE
ncbi:MAG: class I SAM-dependent methyltransferase, partial [Acidiferrobacteraceae bacterium]